MAVKSILINYNGYPASPCNLMPDNGLANLAGALISKGHKTKIFDFATVDIIKKLYPYSYKLAIFFSLNRIMRRVMGGKTPRKEDIRKFNDITRRIEVMRDGKIREMAREISSYISSHEIDFVGFKLWTGDGFRGAVIIAEEIRKAHPHIPIIAGGPHVHRFHEKIFTATDVFDIIVDGEGEDVITQLAEYVEGKKRLEDIPNLIYKRGGEIICNPIKRIEDVNTIAPPVYDEDVYPAMIGNQKIKIILLDESRGCPNTCSFCIHSAIAGHRWRLADPDHLVDTIEYIKNNYGFKAFRFAGSNPPLVLSHNISEEIARRNLDIVFTTNMHVRNLKEQHLTAMKKAGCIGGFFGVESGSQEILNRAMNKNVDVDQVRRAFMLCKKVGIETVASIVHPAPFETEKTKRETLRLLKDIRPESTLVCAPCLIPGSEWDKNKRQYGFELASDEAFFKEVMTYKIDIFTPPILWKPLKGYKLNGRSFQDLAGESYKFSQALEKNGLITQLTDEMFIMAKYADMTPAQFKNECIKDLLSGNSKRLEKIVARINKGVVIPKKSSAAPMILTTSPSA